MTASRTNRSLTDQAPDRAAGLKARRIVLANPVLLLYRRMVDTALAEAKKTRNGLPTGVAVSQRWWIQEFRPDRKDRNLYPGSLESCCEHLDLDYAEERKRMLAEVDDAWSTAAVRHAADQTYRLRAAVLTAAGVPTGIGRQFVLGLIHPDDYEDVAALDRPDPPARPKRSKHKQISKAA